MATNTINRRHFISSSFMVSAAALVGFNTQRNTASCGFVEEKSIMMIGPLEGYTPHIGTLVSMLNYNRETILRSVKNLTMDQLDHLFDEKSNTIGALLLHLAAVEKFYQINTFEGRQDFNENERKVWQNALELGDAGRKHIKGNDLPYYLTVIKDVRNKTLEELKKKDDNWLLAKDPEWSKRMNVNNYWKWFHVCEHESNHRGQITWYMARLPGVESAKD